MSIHKLLSNLRETVEAKMYCIIILQSSYVTRNQWRKAVLMKKFLKVGINNSITVHTPVKVILTTAAENFSGDFATAALPNPCAAFPNAKPTENGSFTPAKLNILSPKLDPTIPAMTTARTVIAKSAPVNFDPAIAKGVVIHRVNAARTTEFD